MAYFKKDENSFNGLNNAVNKILGDLKVTFLIQINNWKLDDAYQTLRTIWMEAEANFKPNEITDMTKSINNLEKSRSEYLKNKLSMGEFYIILEKTYRQLNLLMKENNMFSTKQDFYGEDAESEAEIVEED